MTKCLAAIIGLAAITVLAADGNECFFNYFTAGLKEAAGHPQLRQARNVGGKCYGQSLQQKRC